MILILLTIVFYNKIPYSSFSISKIGVDELNGTISINLQGFLKQKSIELLKVDQGIALYYIEGNGLCLNSTSYLNEDNYTKNKISIKDLKYGHIKYLGSTCEQKINDQYKIIDNNNNFKII